MGIQNFVAYALLYRLVKMCAIRQSGSFIPEDVNKIINIYNRVPRFSICDLPGQRGIFDVSFNLDHTAAFEVLTWVLLWPLSAQVYCIAVCVC